MRAISAIRNMIDCGITNRTITDNYQIFGHRDVGNTHCPGERFYQLIRTWPDYSNRGGNNMGPFG